MWRSLYICGVVLFKNSILLHIFSIVSEIFFYVILFNNYLVFDIKYIFHFFLNFTNVLLLCVSWINMMGNSSGWKWCHWYDCFQVAMTGKKLKKADVLFMILTVISYHVRIQFVRSLWVLKIHLINWSATNALNYSKCCSKNFFLCRLKKKWHVISWFK